jgi:hypothetical protein
MNGISSASAAPAGSSGVTTSQPNGFVCAAVAWSYESANVVLASFRPPENGRMQVIQAQP